MGRLKSPATFRYQIFDSECNLYSELQGNYTGNLNYPKDDLFCSNGFYTVPKLRAVMPSVFYDLEEKCEISQNV